MSESDTPHAPEAPSVQPTDAQPPAVTTLQQAAEGLLFPSETDAPFEPFFRPDEALREFLIDNKLTQKYWVAYFTDLVVDRTWGTISAPSPAPAPAPPPAPKAKP